MTQPTITPYPAPYVPYAQPTGPASAPPTRPRRSFGRSALVAGAGSVLLAASFTVLQWYRKDYGSVGGGGSKARFHDIHDSLDTLQHQLKGNPFKSFIDLGFAPSYYSWLAWTLLALAVAATAVAVSPLGTGLVRGGAAVVGAVGAGVTLWNLQLFTFNAQLRGEMGSSVPDGYWEWFKHTSFGAWAALAGFLLLAAAALIGPRRRTLAPVPG
jgi:hypothetical protein